MKPDPRKRLSTVEIEVEMLERATAMADRAVRRELADALADAHERDANSLRWLICMCERRLEQMEFGR